MLASSPLQQDDKVQVVVALRLPNITAEVSAQAEQIVQAQDSVIDSVSPTDFELTHRYYTVAGMAGMVTSEGLQALRDNPQVQAVDLDMPVQATLDKSTSFIRATEVWAKFGLTGKGVNVALLDTGLDPTHVDLMDNLVAQHCFNHATCLPDNSDESNSAQDEQGHGTHVAGIITSRGQVAPRGIAPDAGLVAVRVLNKYGSGWTSDVVKGIDWVTAHRDSLNVRIINLSLGGGSYSGVCDQESANTILYAEAIKAAHNAGIIVFAASGNEGQSNGLMAPACVSDVVSVGNVYDVAVGQFTWPTCSEQNILADQVTCSSNSSPELDLLAPGTSIVSTGLGGGRATLSGTSMSTPHASAVAALLLQGKPSLTPSQIETILKESGVPIKDNRTGLITPRIDAFAAVSRIATPIITTTFISGTVRLQGRSKHGGVNILVSEQPCATATFTLWSTSSTPFTVTDESGHFQVAVQTGQSYHCLRAVRSGYLSGQYENPPDNLGTLTLLNGDVNNDNLINILDIAMIGSNYGSNNAVSDLNADSKVDIFDLTLAASNFRKIGPLTDWH